MSVVTQQLYRGRRGLSTMRIVMSPCSKAIGRPAFYGLAMKPDSFKLLAWNWSAQLTLGS